MLALLALFLTSYGQRSSVAETKLSLSEAIMRSQQHSNAIESALHDSSAAMYGYLAAKSLRFPTLSLSAVSFYIDELQSIDVPPKSIEMGVKENYQADFRLSLPLFSGGKISNQIRMQEENAQAVSHGVDAERLRNAYMTRTAYLQLMIARATVKSAEASLERINIIRGDVQSFFASGMADSVDLLDAELAFQEAIQMVDERKMAERNASASLARLIGVSADESLLLSEPIPTPVPLELDDRISSPEEINRPELRVLNHQIKSAEHLVGVNRAGSFPVLSGYTGYSVGKPNRDLFHKSWNDNFTAGISLAWEFNLGGGSIRSTQAAKQMVSSARAAKRELEESLALQAKTSGENLRHAHTAFAVSRKQYGIAKRKSRLAEEKQKAGQISVNRLLELEAELTATEQVHQASNINYYLKEADYLYTIGSSKIYGGL